MKKMFLAVAVFALVMLPMAGMADDCKYVYITGAGDLDNGRSSAVGGGISGNGAWFQGNFSIDWTITQPGGAGNPYNYYYEITATGQQGGLSNFILQVSDGFEFYDDPSGSFTDYEGPRWFGLGYPGSADDNLLYDIFGVKFEGFAEQDKNTISFLSNNPPVWGDFYAKGGGGTSGTFAQNAGIAIDPCDASDYIGYIAVPDTAVVPLPSSLLLVGSGLLGLVGLRRKLF